MDIEKPKSDAEIIKQRNTEIMSLAGELSEKTEGFHFTGIDPEVYIRIKASDEEYPGFTTPIGDIIKRCQTEGIKVVVGTHPSNVGNVYILPMQSNDIENDGTFPKNLQITEDMDESLKQLILKDRARF